MKHTVRRMIVILLLLAFVPTTPGFALTLSSTSFTVTVQNATVNGQTQLTLTFDEIAALAGTALDHSFLTRKKELPAYGYAVGKIWTMDYTLFIYVILAPILASVFTHLLFAYTLIETRGLGLSIVVLSVCVALYLYYVRKNKRDHRPCPPTDKDPSEKTRENEPYTEE